MNKQDKPSSPARLHRLVGQLKIRNHMNPNDIVEIKPTDDGWLEIVRYVDEANDRMRQYPRLLHRMSVPVADYDGYIRGQFWSLMQFFDWAGSHAGRDIHFSDMRLPNPKDHRADQGARLVCVESALSAQRPRSPGMRPERSRMKPENDMAHAPVHRLVGQVKPILSVSKADAKRSRHLSNCAGYEDCVCFGRYYSHKDMYKIQMALKSMLLSYDILTKESPIASIPIALDIVRGAFIGSIDIARECLPNTVMDCATRHQQGIDGATPGQQEKTK